MKASMISRVNYKLELGNESGNISILEILEYTKDAYFISHVPNVIHDINTFVFTGFSIFTILYLFC